LKLLLLLFRLLPSALCLLPSPNRDHQKLPRTHNIAGIEILNRKIAGI
jgi:hypothetical protein